MEEETEVFTYRIKSNIEYSGLDFPCGNVRQITIETEKEIKIYDKDAKLLIFEAMKTAKMIAEWVTVDQLWLSDKTPLCAAKINFVSKYSYWQNGVVGFWEKI